MNLCCIVFAVMYIYSKFLTVDDPDEHMGFHSNYISERLGVKVLHLYVQSGATDEYWGPMTHEQRVGHVFEDSLTRSRLCGLPFIGLRGSCLYSYLGHLVS